MKVLKQIWVAFNRWRKRYWLCRVILLSVLAAYAVVGAWFLPMLVGIACDAILADAEPRMLNAIYRSNRANATRRVQAALLAKLDEDEDGTLTRAELESAEAIGLDPVQLTLAPLQVDLEHLVASAQRADLVSLSYTARVIRKDAWRAALVEADETMAPERRKVESALAWWRRPDYRSASTWGRGLVAFRDQFLWPNLYGLIGNPFHWIPFFAVTYLAALITVVLLRGRRAAAALLTTLVISGAVNGLWAAVLPHSVRFYHVGDYPGFWLCAACDSLLILAVAVPGARRGARYTNPSKALRLSVLIIGAILVAWGILPTPGYALRLDGTYRSPFLLNGEIFPIMKTWIAVIGAAVLAHGVVLIVLHSRRRREHPATAV